MSLAPLLATPDIPAVVETNNDASLHTNTTNDDDASSTSSVVPLDDAPHVLPHVAAQADPPLVAAAPNLCSTVARMWSAVGRKEVDVWRIAGAVRALAFYAFATVVVTAVALSVDRSRACSLPVFEWLAGHAMVLLLRFVTAFAIMRISRHAHQFERRRAVLGYVSRACDAGCVLVCLVGLSYVFSTASGDCPATSPYSYRALALLVSFESLAALLAIFVAGCMMAGGWARGFCVGNMNFNAVVHQLENPLNRGATLQQITSLPLRRFVKSGSVPVEKDGTATEDVEELQVTNKHSDNDDEMECACAVCLGEYEPRDLVRVLPCEHYFHRECIDTWLMRNKTCPFCKHSIDQPPPAHSSSVHSSTYAETASTDAEDD